MQVFFALVILTGSWGICLGITRAQLRPTPAWRKAGNRSSLKNLCLIARPSPSRLTLPASVKKRHKQDFRAKTIKNDFYFACNYKIKTTFA
jgi:hypothetical protein